MRGIETMKFLLPPACVALGRRLLRSRLLGFGGREWEYLPGGWDALPPGGTGWNDPSVAETQLRKWPAFVRSVTAGGPLGVSHEAPAVSDGDYAAHNTVMCFAYALAFAARCKGSLSFLDWGGGIGHYAVIARALLPGVTIDYHCKDLPLLCAAGRQVLTDATFHEDEGTALAREYDFVVASSSLHYSRDWRTLARRLAGATCGCLYVTRTPVVHRASSFVVVQRPHAHGYHTEYPGWFLNRGELLDSLTATGLEPVREFLIEERPFVPGAPEQAEYRGVLLRRT